MGVLRLGGHGAAAFALWWLEEGSNSEFHFDQAGVTFQVTHITKCFLQILVAGASQ